MDRREFIKVCSALGAGLLLPKLSFPKGTSFKAYNRVLLVNKEGKPLKEEDLKVGENYLFFYPYVSTPAFLINVGKEVRPQKLKTEKGEYLFKGGVGSKKSIVAFTAICAHQLTHPTPNASFISYYPDLGEIRCCAHQSHYNVLKGGKVVSGPADYPLLAIVLEEENGEFYAVGTLGVERFEEFFRVFRRELRKRFRGLARAKELVKGQTKVLTLKEYSKGMIITC